MVDDQERSESIFATSMATGRGAINTERWYIPYYVMNFKKKFEMAS